jgi:hydrogenase expression/formation protein HypC
MCLAVPMRVIEADGPRGLVEASGVRHEVRFDLVGDVRVGEFVLIHAGYAIQVMAEAAAAEQLALLESILAADEEVSPKSDAQSGLAPGLAPESGMDSGLAPGPGPESQPGA